MSHEITVRKDGTEEFFSAGGTPVWHRLGQRTDQAVTSGAALRMAGLDWLVQEHAIYSDIGDEMRPIPGHKSIVRVDNGEVLGIVGQRYRPVQNEEAFSWLDGLVGSRMAIYETAGSIKGGALVWALVRLPGELRIQGTDDVVKPFILVCNSHDGSIAFRALNTSVRVVCANTLTMALSGAGLDSISVKHTERVHDRIADAQQVLGLSVQRHRLFELQMNAMARRKLTTKAFELYMDRLLGAPREEDELDDTTARQQIRGNFDHPLQRMKGIEHSAWSAFNAATQFVDWERAARGATQQERDERRLASIWFGAGATVKRRAFGLALELVRVPE